MPKINECESTIYSLDIVERIVELSKLDIINWDQRIEWLELLLLQKNFSSSSEFFSGLTLINSKNFESYMDEMIQDSYEIPKLPKFLSLKVDYSMLKKDYIEIEFRGETFFAQP